MYRYFPKRLRRKVYYFDAGDKKSLQPAAQKISHI